MIGFTPQSLLALAVKTWRDDPELLASTMLSCQATLSDLVAAANDDGIPYAADLVNDIIDARPDDLNWRTLAEAWPGRRKKLPVPEVIETPPAPPLPSIVPEVIIDGVLYRLTIERVSP